jgi:hypothetical protein
MTTPATRAEIERRAFAAATGERMVEINTLPLLDRLIKAGILTAY